MCPERTPRHHGESELDAGCAQPLRAPPSRLLPDPRDPSASPAPRARRAGLPGTWRGPRRVACTGPAGGPLRPGSPSSAGPSHGRGSGTSAPPEKLLARRGPALGGGAGSGREPPAGEDGGRSAPCALVTCARRRSVPGTRVARAPQGAAIGVRVRCAARPAAPGVRLSSVIHVCTPSTTLQSDLVPLGSRVKASLSLAPVNIFKAGADEERAETARLVSRRRVALFRGKMVPWATEVNGDHLLAF